MQFWKPNWIDPLNYANQFWIIQLLFLRGRKQTPLFQKCTLLMDCWPNRPNPSRMWIRTYLVQWFCQRGGMKQYFNIGTLNKFSILVYMCGHVCWWVVIIHRYAFWLLSSILCLPLLDSILSFAESKPNTSQRQTNSSSTVFLLSFAWVPVYKCVSCIQISTA